jgi:hypothetical protein
MNRGRYPQSSVENPAAHATIDQDRNPVRRRSSGASLTFQPLCRSVFVPVGTSVQGKG